MTMATLRATAAEAKEIERFAVQLKTARLAAQFSRAELAKRAGLSDATIKFLETCRVRPTTNSVSALLSVPELGLPLDAMPTFLRDAVAPILAQKQTTQTKRIEFLCPSCRRLLIPCGQLGPHCTLTSYRPIPTTDQEPKDGQPEDGICPSL